MASKIAALCSPVHKHFLCFRDALTNLPVRHWILTAS